MDQNNLIFCTNGHDFNKRPKSTIIKRIEKDFNIKQMILKKDKWIKPLKTYVPFGFNMKINHPTLK